MRSRYHLRNAAAEKAAGLAGSSVFVPDAAKIRICVIAIPGPGCDGFLQIQFQVQPPLPFTCLRSPSSGVCSRNLRDQFPVRQHPDEPPSRSVWRRRSSRAPALYSSSFLGPPQRIDDARVPIAPEIEFVEPLRPLAIDEVKQRVPGQLASRQIAFLPDRPVIIIEELVRGIDRVLRGLWLAFRAQDCVSDLADLSGKRAIPRLGENWPELIRPRVASFDRVSPPVNHCATVTARGA